MASTADYYTAVPGSNPILALLKREVFVAKEVHPESKTSMKYVDDQPT
jgi:hypothetical protein